MMENLHTHWSKELTFIGFNAHIHGHIDIDTYNWAQIKKLSSFNSMSRILELVC